MKPSCYRDWHKLYHDEIYALGLNTSTEDRLKVLVQMLPDVFIDRLSELRQRKSNRIRRLRRIEAHLHDCQENNDPTWLEHSAWVDSLMNEGSEP